MNELCQPKRGFFSKMKTLFIKKAFENFLDVKIVDGILTIDMGNTTINLANCSINVDSLNLVSQGKVSIDTMNDNLYLNSRMSDQIKDHHESIQYRATQRKLADEMYTIGEEMSTHKIPQDMQDNEKSDYIKKYTPKRIN